MQPSWEGPYEIKGVAGPLPYEIEVNGKKKCVYIKFLKEWHEKTVKRITTTLEDDTECDKLRVTNPNVQVEVGESDSVFQKKLETLLKGCTDVLCDEPGLMEMVELETDTGDAPPIYQSAYNTLVSVREKVTEEIEWLKSTGYIRELQSPWASPIVTVRKPSGAIRLCMRLNAVTGLAPFYMPTVEETLEAVTKAKVISTIDLNKGYYQVRVSSGIYLRQPLCVGMGILNS